MRPAYIAIFLTIVFTACSEYTPKPVGYMRIEREDFSFREFATPYFSFHYSSQAHIDTVVSENKNDIWFNIIYPGYNARIYCSYSPITKATLKQALEDSYHLAYSHTIKAGDIKQKLYTDNENNISGTVYDIDGMVATPVQFFLTDSTSNFFRGSFYYDNQINPDSVSPVSEYIKNDITTLIESFRWK